MEIKKELPLLILLIVSLLMIVPFFVNIPVLKSAGDSVQRMLSPIASFGLILGGAEILLRQGSKISKKTDDAPFAYLLVASFVILFVLALTPSLSSLYNTIYITIIGRVNETVFSLIALFMASWAYRAFQMKNIETGLFGFSCLIVLISNAPFGVVFWGGAPAAGSWLINVPNMAAMRAINISVALGIFAYGVRTMLGHERIALGEVSKKQGDTEE